MKPVPALLLLVCLGIAPAQPVRADAGAEMPYDEGAQSPQRLAANAEIKAIALRTGAINDRADARRAVDRLQNFYRCHDAMQVVALCGSSAADFACDDRGFIAAAGPAAPRPPPSSGRKSEMRRCAMHASRGLP